MLQLQTSQQMIASIFLLGLGSFVLHAFALPAPVLEAKSMDTIHEDHVFFESEPVNAIHEDEILPEIDNTLASLDKNFMKIDASLKRMASRSSSWQEKPNVPSTKRQSRLMKLFRGCTSDQDVISGARVVSNRNSQAASRVGILENIGCKDLADAATNNLVKITSKKHTEPVSAAEEELNRSELLKSHHDLLIEGHQLFKDVGEVKMRSLLMAETMANQGLPLIPIKDLGPQEDDAKWKGKEVMDMSHEKLAAEKYQRLVRALQAKIEGLKNYNARLGPQVRLFTRLKYGFEAREAGDMFDGINLAEKWAEDSYEDKNWKDLLEEPLRTNEDEWNFRGSRYHNYYERVKADLESMKWKGRIFSSDWITASCRPV